MANSLIPYSFVPGTKAMASEVNANFIALANSVEEGKQYTDGAIEDFNTQFEARLEEYDGLVDKKLQPNMSNSLNISNCIIEQPNRIKYSMDDGVLTIYAGSVVIVPYGLADLSQQYPAGAKFINDNYKVVDTEFSSNGFFVWAEVQTNISARSTYTSKMSVYTPLNLTSNVIMARGMGDTTFVYSTSTNKVLNGSSTDVLSLPLMISTLDSTGYTSVDKVFNGMGYIGNSVWVDKGVKFRVPDGLNPDGTYKNIDYTSDLLLIYTFSNTSTWTRAKQPLMLYLGTPACLSPNTTNDKYFEAYSDPDVNNNYVTWLDLSKNIMYHSDSVVGNYIKVKACLAGYVNIEMGKVKDMWCRPVFKVADMSEVHRLIKTYNSVSKSANGYIKLGDGIIIQWGIKSSQTSQDYSITLPTAFSSTNYSPVVIDRTDGVGQSHCSVTSVTTTGFSGKHSSDGQTIRWIAIGY